MVLKALFYWVQCILFNVGQCTILVKNKRCIIQNEAFKSHVIWLSVCPHLDSDFEWFTFIEQQQKQYYLAFICCFIILKNF